MTFEQIEFDSLSRSSCLKKVDQKALKVSFFLLLLIKTPAPQLLSVQQKNSAQETT